MIARLAALALAVLAAGCSTMTVHIPKEDAFTPAPKVQGIAVHWIASADPTAECKRQFPNAFGFHPLVPACAGWDHEKLVCVIVTGKTATHQILGHEVRHCFEGKFHD
jgi:hypothetical protein